MSKIKVQQSTKILFNPGVLLLTMWAVVIWVGGVWFLYPKVYEAIDAIAMRSSMEEELATITSKVLLVEDINESKFQKRIDDSLLKVLPENIDVPLVLGALVTVGRDNEYEVTAGKTAFGQEQGTFYTQRVDLEMNGAKAKLRDVLEKIGNSAPLMTPTKILYKSVFDENQIQIELSVESYALKDEDYDYSQAENIIVPTLSNDDEKLFEMVSSLDQVIPTLDFSFLGDENKNPFLVK